ncbi:hypothetical protein TRFO_34048 [Tritrichomonas foetus]|uniref:Raptor N-terminal CASPase-like domain-containing protein n=1 Tax=Tritrichomonas foetus TaxID=1144522 RepID=A0A1J4JPR2_9EUKA|nr:hypothetical protein TRFO_34048 [Tritrichomonas foetus]|eukprot:OHS99507.1 hypothetical protein TRFO_34048 [Tritrichomonas foetus]
MSIPSSTSTESTYSDDDTYVGHGLYRQNKQFYAKQDTFPFPPSNTIPRTSGYEHSISPNSIDDLEDTHADYPVSDYISQFYNDFQNRIIKPPDQFYTHAIPPDEAIQIPRSTTPGIERVLIHLLDWTSLNISKKSQSKYIHSWCDTSLVTSVEARRLIQSFFNNGYSAIIPNGSMTLRVEISTSKAPSHWLFNRLFPKSVRLFHYVGMGFPPPEEDRIFMTEAQSSHEGWTSLKELWNTLHPAILIFDCDKAAIVNNFLMGTKNRRNSIICRDSNTNSTNSYSSNLSINTNNKSNNKTNNNSNKTNNSKNKITNNTTNNNMTNSNATNNNMTNNNNTNNTNVNKNKNANNNSYSNIVAQNNEIDNRNNRDNSNKKNSNTDVNNLDNISDLNTGVDGDLLFAFYACAKNEQLRIPSTLPQNFFSCILLSPAEAFSAITSIKVQDLKMFEQLLTIFTETIAMDTLPTETFYRLFRSNPTIASLWQRFFLAQRLMHTFGLHSQSYPEMKDTSEHQLWYQFEYTLMSTSNCTYSNMNSNANPIIKLSNMYNITFDGLDYPPQYVSAFMASFLQVEEIHKDVLHRIANFMSKSPQNCYTMGKVLNFRNFNDFSKIFLSNEDYFTDWSCVLSGFLLVAPSLTNMLSKLPTSDVIKICTSPNYGDRIKVFLLSILVTIRDRQSHLICSFNPETTDKILSLIFYSSPILREWIIIFCHSSSARYNSDANIIGPTGIHTITMLLLYENRKFTRAIALAVLTTIMTTRSPEFNETIMRCALKASIDGSHIVRHAFLLCAAIYMKLNNVSINENEKEYELDYLIRKDIQQFTNTNTNINLNNQQNSDQQNNLIDKQIVPQITPLLKFLMKDPYEENSNFAKKIIESIETMDLNELVALQNEYTCYIHKMAHTLLFSQKCSKYQIHQRYCDNFFSDDQLEQFELIDTNTGPIVAIAFDYSHKTFCTASANGIVAWGENRWKICENNEAIQAICPLSDLSWAVVSNVGVVYVLRDGLEKPIDAFMPSMKPPTGKTIMLSSPDSSHVYISQGNNELLVWDIEALLMIDRIDVENPIKLMAKINEFLYLAFENGVVVQLNTKTNDIIGRNEMHKGQNIVRIGNHNNILFSATENGPLFFWEDFEFPRQISDEWNFCNDFLVHPIYPIAIKTNEICTLLQLYEDAPIELQTNRKHTCTCCCFDGNRPLCAIGYDDGFVSVWRITKPNEQML